MRDDMVSVGQFSAFDSDQRAIDRRVQDIDEILSLLEEETRGDQRASVSVLASGSEKEMRL